MASCQNHPQDNVIMIPDDDDVERFQSSDVKLVEISKKKIEATRELVETRSNPLDIFNVLSRIKLPSFSSADSETLTTSWKVEGGRPQTLHAKNSQSAKWRPRHGLESFTRERSELLL